MADKLKFYIKTSFVCYLTGDQTANAKISADQAYTRQWWGEEKSACDAFISKYVIGECAVGREDAVAKRDAVLRELPMVVVDGAAVDALAQMLIDGHALPAGETTDALHIASAAVGRMDVLLTWNCRHMANPHTLPKTIEIIEKSGVSLPVDHDPEDLSRQHELGGAQCLKTTLSFKRFVPSDIRSRKSAAMTSAKSANAPTRRMSSFSPAPMRRKMSTAG